VFLRSIQIINIYIYDLTPSLQETKEVVISLHHFRKQLIAHEQQIAQAESPCSPKE
jgi:hypothetical protein